MRAAAPMTALWSVGGTTHGLPTGRIWTACSRTMCWASVYLFVHVAIGTVGQTYVAPAIVALFVSAAGMCITGTNGLTATLYPMRATGVTWAIGIGRLVLCSIRRSTATCCCRGSTTACCSRRRARPRRPPCDAISQLRSDFDALSRLSVPRAWERRRDRRRSGMRVLALLTQ